MTLDGRVRGLETLEAPDAAVEAWLAMRTMPLALPGVRGVWLMNQSQAGTIYDASSQSRHMSTNGTVAVAQLSSLLRYLVFDGSTTYLNRASESGLEITNALSVLSWSYKATAATQFPMLAKTQGFSANANTSFYFVHGTSDNLNLTVTSGTTSYSQTVTAPVGEWFFGGANYTPSTAIKVYLGTQDAWVADQNTTSIPASINAAVSTDLTIGATHGGANFAGGNIAASILINANLTEAVFRTFFEYTKAIFYS